MHLFNVALILLLGPLSFLSATESGHNIIGCEIFAMDKKMIRKFPGELCAFMRDGQLLASEESQIVSYGKKNNKLWTKEIKAHHQVNLNLAQEKFLVIGSRTVTPKNKAAARSDVLYLINRHGDIEKSFDLFEQQAQFDKIAWNQAASRKFPIVWTPSRFSDASWELTHVNSFYEIPENSFAKVNSAFSKGNFIVNDISLMLVFVLSADLKKVLWQSRLSTEAWTMYHDVQVLENGHLLYYENKTTNKSYTSLIEYDLQNNKIVWVYNRDPKKSFNAPHWGGVQLLKDKNILFTDITSGPKSIVIDRSGKVLWEMQSPPKTYLQQIKRQDLTAFLYNNKGL